MSSGRADQRPLREGLGRQRGWRNAPNGRSVTGHPVRPWSGAGKAAGQPETARSHHHAPAAGWCGILV